MFAEEETAGSFTVGAVADRAIVPLPGVVWRSCDFRVGATEGLVHGSGGERLHVPLPAELRQSVDKRRSEYLAGRLCALLALREAGAPEIVGRSGRAPVWPAGVRGSISHCDDRAMSVVSHRVSALGLDCEPLISPRTAAGIARRILTPEDHPFRPWGWEEPRFLTLIFSAKEALYKALSDRLTDVPGFAEAHVVALEGDRLVLAFRDWRVQVGYSFDRDCCVTLAWLD